MAELGHSEPRGCPTSSFVMLLLWESPQVPEATVLTKVTFASTRKVTLGSRMKHTCPIVFSIPPRTPQTWGLLQLKETWKIINSPSPLYFTMRSLRFRKSKITCPRSEAKAGSPESSFPHFHISAALSNSLYHLGLPITAHLHPMVLLLHPLPQQNSSTSIPTLQVSASWPLLCWETERILECQSRKVSNI